MTQFYGIDESYFTNMTPVHNTDIVFHDIEVQCQGARCNKGSKGKTLLKRISGYFNEGELVGILGQSGAGKTTLLEVLCQQREYRGTVLFGGKAPRKEQRAYVRQDDVFFGSLTVQEHLEYQMRLRRSDVTKQEMKQQINKLLRLFSLENVVNTRIGDADYLNVNGISSGERKRLSIATEMINESPILFADEPTSGLDTEKGKDLILMIKQLTKTGRTVVCTIHQPSSSIFFLFDKIVIIIDGEIGYIGPSSEIVGYFSNLGFNCPRLENPADFIMHQIRDKNNALKFLDSWKNFNVGKHLEYSALNVRKQFSQSETFSERSPIRADELDDRKSGFLSQLLTLVSRNIRCTVRSRNTVITRMISSFIMGVVFGLLYLRRDQSDWISKNGGAFQILLQSGCGTMMAVLTAFTSDLGPGLRETGDNIISIPAYFLSKNIADIPLQIIIPLITIPISWYMAGLNDARGGIALGIGLLVTNCLAGLGYLIGSLSKNINMSSLILPLFMSPMMLSSGNGVVLSTMPVGLIWIQYVFPIRWALSGIYKAMYEDMPLQTCHDVGPPACFSSGNKILDFYGYADDSYTKIVSIIIFQAFVYRILGCLILMISRRK